MKHFSLLQSSLCVSLSLCVCVCAGCCQQAQQREQKRERQQKPWLANKVAFSLSLLCVRQRILSMDSVSALSIVGCNETNLIELSCMNRHTHEIVTLYTRSHTPTHIHIAYIHTHTGRSARIPGSHWTVQTDCLPDSPSPRSRDRTDHQAYCEKGSPEKRRLETEEGQT